MRQIVWLCSCMVFSRRVGVEQGCTSTCTYTFAISCECEHRPPTKGNEKASIRRRNATCSACEQDCAPVGLNEPRVQFSPFRPVKRRLPTSRKVGIVYRAWRAACYSGAAFTMWGRIAVWDQPPSTTRVCPVICCASGERRKSAARAMSSGSARRPEGVMRVQRST